MENEIKVSVVCTVFNHGAYLRDALEGFVMQQTTFPFEVLIHDDASTDNSPEIIREYEAKYPDIIKPIYQTENQFSQNVPFQKLFIYPRIQGKYVAMCEGDDYWTDPLKLQKQYDFMEANPDYTLCACSVAWLDMNTGNVIKRCRTDADRDVSLEEIILETKGRVFQFATVFAKREIVLDRPAYLYGFGVGDAPLAINAALNGKVRMLADEMAVYRNHAAGSWTARIAKDSSYKVAAFERMIGGYTRLNAGTNYQHDDVIKLRILRLKYNIARTNRDLKGMRSGELREIWRSRSLAARASDILACKAPRLQVRILQLLKRS